MSEPTASDAQNRAEAAEARCSRLQQALRREFFKRLPDLDYEVREGVWAWQDDSDYVLLGITEDECYEALAGLESREGPVTGHKVTPTTPATDWPRFAREIRDGDTAALAAQLPAFLRPDADTPADSLPLDSTDIRLRRDRLP